MNTLHFEHAPTPAFRLLARQAPSQSCDIDAALASLWYGALGGKFVVAIGADSDGAVELSLHTLPPLRGRLPPSESDRLAFDDAIRGKQQKVVALERQRSNSTVAGQLRRVARSMGLTCSFMRLPLPIPLLSHAVRHPELVVAYEEGERMGGTPTRYTVKLRRCDEPLRFILSKGEQEVGRLLLYGYSHADIARQRRTSERTVANQIASIYEKTRASGRFGLVRMLVHASCNKPYSTARSPVGNLWAPEGHPQSACAH